MPFHPSIWGLIDDRPGHAAQVRGLLGALGLASVEVPLSYGPLAHLPDALLGSRLAHLDSVSRARVRAPWPDLVIACGRRTAPAARYIKRHHPATLLVYLMRPPSLTGLDLIIAPAHDAVDGTKRTLATLGPLHPVNEAQLQAAREEWEPRLASFTHPRIGVLLGGAPAGGTFDHARAVQMLRRAEALAGPEGSLLISGSRRTPPGLRAELEPQVKAKHLWYTWESGGPNPYMGILACADALVVGGDSLSMCAEAAATGKPLFIATGDHLPPKHRAMHSALFIRGSAQPLSESSRLGWSPAPPLDEATRIAAEVKRRLLPGA